MSKIFLILVSFATLSYAEAFAQSNTSFQVASRLFQQQRYEEALPILVSIHRQEPQVFEFLNLLVECHMQLKQYDDAENSLKNSLKNNVNQGSTNLLLAKLYHIKGDTATAYSVWDNNLKLYSNDMSLFYKTGKAMVELKEFDRAVEILLMAREIFDNDNLFMMDLPNIYMQAGKYPEAISEWLNNIENNTNIVDIFKRNLISYNDPLLFEDSIAEIEYKLREIPINHPTYRIFFDLQIWLLFENKLYKRAFAAALKYEKSTIEFNFTLIYVGHKLLDNQQFELSLEAFTLYRDSDDIEIKMMAYDNMAEVYARWAKHLEDYNLSSKDKIHLLYSESITVLDTLIEFYSNYREIKSIYLRKAELSFDQLYDLKSAKDAVTLFKTKPYTEGTAQAHYLDGRIFLAENKYVEARIEFTRSNRLARTGSLAEKTRYFLALTDFYSGDFEFATIQLKTLSRKNTSYYANDALKLRLWLQEGASIDTLGTQMQIFADAIKSLNKNPFEFDDSILLDYIDRYPNTTFKDDVLLAIATHIDEFSPRYISYLNEFLDFDFPSPLRENLLWLRAIKFEYLNIKISSINLADANNNGEDCNFSTEYDNDKMIRSTREFYEELILEYPNGFYAPYARRKLIELPS